MPTAEWDRLEAAGLVRLQGEAEEENYFDVYGSCACGCTGEETRKHDAETARLIEQGGLWYYSSEYRLTTDSPWIHADGLGMCVGAVDPYPGDELRDAAVDAFNAAQAKVIQQWVESYPPTLAG